MVRRRQQQQTRRKRPQPASSVISKAVRRTRMRRRRERQLRSGPRTTHFADPSYGMDMYATDNTIYGTTSKMNLTGLTTAGAGFLKCAFAPPDFASEEIRGVPDEFEGLSLIKRHKLVSPFTISANTDYYFVLAPVPGYAYFYLSVTAGSTLTNVFTLTGVPYADSSTIFGSNANYDTTADILSDFRYVSNHIELIPTVNQMQWTGSIQVMRARLSMTVRPNQSTAYPANNIHAVNGLQAINNFGNVQQYTGNFHAGCYSGAYNTDSSFNFCPIVEGLGSIPNSISSLDGDFGQLGGYNNIPLAGIDPHFDSIMIKISGIGSNTLDSMMIKTWSCVEYKVVTGSILYEYQNLSPCDARALALYRAVIKQLPIAVPYFENEGFWERVLRIIKKMSAGGSFIPGPIGTVSSGVNAITSGLEQLLM
jgi:hypothetical protein